MLCRQRSMIVLGKARSSLPPIFFVNPAGALAWCYSNLARALPARRPVYGLQASALDPALRLLKSMNTLAA